MYNAFTLTKNGKSEDAFELRKYDHKKLSAEEVRIKVSAFGLNYADVMARNGLYKECPPLPTVIGYEVVGTIIEANTANSKELIGKKVVAFTRFGGYAQEVVTQLSATVIIDDYPEDKALALATQYVTAYYMVHYTFNFHKNNHVLIHAAAGGVGTALVQLLQSKGVNIIAKVGSDEKAKYLNDLGVEHCVNYNTQNYAQFVKDVLKDNSLVASFNPSGGKTFQTDLKLLGPHGKLFLYGGAERSGKKWGIFSTLNFVRKMGIILPITLMMQSKSLIGVNMLKIADEYPEILQKCLSEVIHLAKKGIIAPKVGGTFHSNELADAHNYLASGKSTGKVVVKW